MVDYEVLGPLAYQGKEDCDLAVCRREVWKDDNGKMRFGPCMGWHCSYCDNPTGVQGHRCDAAGAILDEAKRISGSTYD